MFVCPRSYLTSTHGLREGRKRQIATSIRQQLHASTKNADGISWNSDLAGNEDLSIWQRIDRIHIPCIDLSTESSIQIEGLLRFSCDRVQEEDHQQEQRYDLY